MSDIRTSNSKISRRTVAKGAAWSVPVVAVAAAAPAASASTSNDVGALSLDGTCGALGAGLLSTGLTLTAGPDVAVPAGTVISLSSTGLANIGVFTITGGLASVAVSGSSGTITLTEDLAPGTTMNMTTSINVSVLWTLTGNVQLPSGYTATGGKLSGSVNGTLVLCDAS